MFGRIISAVVLALLVSGANAQALNLNLTGASPAGLWTLIGVGLDQAAKKGEPGSTITYQTSGGGFANIALVDRGQAQLGLVHDAELKIALAGNRPFNAPVTSIRAIGYMYNWAPMHFFVTKRAADRYGIRSLADIAAKQAPLKIAVNRPGNITGDVALAMLKEVGVTPELLKRWGGDLVLAGSGDQASLIVDGRIDAITNGIFVRHSSFMQVDKALDVVLLAVPRDAIARVNEQFGTRSFTIPKASYQHQADDVDTVALGALLVANQSMDGDTVYRLARAMLGNLEEIRKVHPAMGALTPQILTSQTVTAFHPGAERAFREAGLIK
ncbi:MAG: TAXI family TRAP transporter solute-binding subunit [Burkholderiaceae bacterium]|nr:TAXI family TRAP transporter solute-binding subunit [Burkholderiaceae bacterium]